MDNAQILVLIPARYHSRRFPGKPLADIGGKSMIRRVYENCAAVGSSSWKSVVVTDHPEIEEHVKGFAGEVVRVDEDVESGTERIAKAYESYYSQTNWDLIINVQGDEPLLAREELSRLASFHLHNDFDLATLVKPKSCRGETGEEHRDPHRVKAVWTQSNGECHYFSRSAVPFFKDPGGSQAAWQWYLHIGVYSYLPETLVRFANLPQSALEVAEGLEQLRAVEAGMRIGAVATDVELLGVDVPSDIDKVKGALGE